MRSVIRYLCGYVKVRLTGYATERFLNLCTHHYFELWQMSHEEKTYEFCMKLQDFMRIRPLVRKSRTRVRILEKHGLPILLRKAAHYKSFWCGMLLAGILITALSCRIWNVDIIGNERIASTALLTFLKQQNICAGTMQSKISCEETEQLIRRNFSDIIWTSVRIDGTRLVVEVKEKLPTTKKQSLSDTPQDIVAHRNGTILSIVTRAGTPVVQEGQKVKKGDILVSGRLDITDAYGEIKNYIYCNADADIYAETTYTYLYTHAYQSDLFLVPIPIDEEYIQNKAKEHLQAYLDVLEEKGMQILEKNIQVNKAHDAYVFHGTVRVKEKFTTYQATPIMKIDKKEETE